MEVYIEKLIPYSLAVRACNRCSNKNFNTIDMERLYNAEHSPIYTQWFWIDVLGIPPYVHTHFRTHEKLGCQFYVSTSRKGQDREQLETVNMSILCNAMHLINMARKRLCRKADPVTRKVMQMIEQEMYLVDEALAKNLRANCLYRMGCPEMVPCYEVPTK